MVFDDGGTESGFVFDGGANAVQHFVNGSERLRVDSSGNVGIGSTAPRSNLEISDSSGGELTLRYTGNSGFAAIKTDGNSALLFSAGATSFSTDMTIDSSGNVLVGTTTSNYSAASGFGVIAPGAATYAFVAHANGTSNSTDYIAFSYNGSRIGNITQASTSSVAYNTSSDYRLKEAVVNMTGAIDRVKALAPKRFNFIIDPDTTVDGFLAHEAQAVVPEAVTGTHNEVDADGDAVMQGIDQSKLVPLLTGALREAIAKIETLEIKVAALEAAE